MDDILASIRRILNEDEAAAEAGDVAEPVKHEPEPDPEPEAVAAPRPPITPAPVIAPPPRAPSGPEPVELTSDMLVTPPNLPPAAPSRMGLGMDDASGLIAPAAAAAAAASMGSLMRAVSSERGSPVYRGGPSIEDVVREEIRPILKDWLDTHLPPLVERLVRAEIEKVVNRALP